MTKEINLISKYNITVETHCHSAISNHATSTLNEHINKVKSTGMRGLCLTNHAPAYMDGTTPAYFDALKKSPSEIEGIRFYPGAEVNICDYNGSLDLPDTCIAGLKWIIAAIHKNCLNRGNENDITNAYLGVLENPFVDCLGHIGQSNFLCNFEKVVKKAKECGKFIEINNSSLMGMRKGAEKLCFDVAKLCKKYEAEIAVGSDAHSSSDTGRYDKALILLEEIDFPEKLIINSDYEKFNNYIIKKRGK